jgi:adenylyltransferase/sulfurtransferase
MLFPAIGETGQKKVQSSIVVIVGCGALGTVIANNLCRAGVGRLRIVDRDFVEESDLQRQSLFTEQDAAQRLPKAIAAARHIALINSAIAVEPIVADVCSRNVKTLLAEADIVLDATDNLETRFLINDECVKENIPWVYGGAVGAEGMVMPIIPRETPCLRCFIEEPPPPGALPTCDRAGILNAASGAVGSLQTAAALRILVGAGAWAGPLLSLDVWKGEFKMRTLAPRPDCPTCAHHRFEFLEGKGASWTNVLCGRDMIQVMPPEERPVDLSALAQELSAAGAVSFNGFMLTLKAPPHELTLFPNGRALIKGAADVAEARSLYARYVGI